MTERTIKAILAKKFNDFVSSIDDVELQEQVKKNTIITGGCIASMLLNEKINDFDLYFRSLEVARAVASHYLATYQQQHPNFSSSAKVELYQSVVDNEYRLRIYIPSAGKLGTNDDKPAYDQEDSLQGGEFIDEETAVQAEELKNIDSDAGDFTPPPARYIPLFITDNAISLSNKIQLIIRFYGEPEVVHKNFDFVHCTCYWQSWDQKLVLPADALKALLAKELIFTNSKYPICSLFRLRKFIKRGFIISAGQILKIALKISELDLTDPAVLQDQLIGVDCLYFLQLLHKLKENHPNKLDSQYIINIIDRMF